MDFSTDKIMDKVDEHLTELAFLYQITEKDIKYAQNSGYWKSLSSGDKVKLIADIVAGRTVGINPFPDIAKYNATFEIGNAINRTSEIGVGLWLASEVGFLSSKWGARGKKIAMGGAIGGVFDADDMGTYPGTRNGGVQAGVLQNSGAPGRMANQQMPQTNNFWGK